MKNLKILTSVRYLTREKSTLRKTALWQLHKGTFAIFTFPVISGHFRFITSGIPLQIANV